MGRETELVPKEDWLEWKGQDGSGPLCEGLGEKRPGGKFRMVNEGAEFAVLIEDSRWDTRRAAKRAGVGMAACLCGRGGDLVGDESVIGGG